MKSDRTNIFLQVLLNSSVFLGIVLSGVVSYSLSSNCGDSFHGQTLLHISLGNFLLLLIALVVANILFSKFRTLPQDNTRHVDPLTGFMTRHAFGEVFQHSLLDAKRSLEPLSVLLIDIDHFRLVNEQHGYQVGDDHLRLLSQSIQSVLRASDISCRWEGNQFLIILEDCSTKDCCRIAEKILLKNRSQTLTRNKKKITLTTSIGVAQMICSDNTETLIARAETGLYSARDIGRDTYAIGYDWILIDYSFDPIF